MLKHSPESDPRWQQITRQYQSDWSLAALELFGLELTHQQIQVIEAMRLNERVSVAVAPGVGTNQLIAVISILRVILYPNGMTVIATRDIKPVSERNIRYMKLLWHTALINYPWLDLYFSMTDTHFTSRFADFWAVFYRSTNSPESVAGFCAQHLTIIVPQASTVNEEACLVLSSSVTLPDNSMLMVSAPNPIKKSGYFYEVHNTQNTNFTTLTLSAEDSPLVDSSYLKMKEEQYGGRDSEQYRITVRALFPR